MPWRRWQAARARLVAALQESPQAAVHVHGFVAALVALRVHARAGGRTPGVVYYSPHGSASLGRLRTLGVVLQWLARTLTGAAPFDRVITCCAVESRLLPGFGSSTAPRSAGTQPPARLPAEVHLAESPVARCFFVQPRRPATEPLVLAGVLDEGIAAAERMARLAVLLGDEVLHTRVRWVGLVRPKTAPLLRAAGIDTLAVGDDKALAGRMAEAWVFVAPVATTRFPLLLAQAMASRLPCVALASPFNAALLKDGESGFLCRDAEQMLARTRELVESAPLRERLGRAARQEAARRFDESLFRQAVLLGYGAPARRTPGGGAAEPALRTAAGRAAGGGAR
ncbi:MAG: glycosyltransferase [Rubrivivax sp.]|nr:glycosyltransferase [Rubrivivax sp.]